MVGAFIAFACLVLAPFLLLPTIIAYKNERRSRHVILALNLALFTSAALIGGGATMVAAVLIGWLALLHFALRKDRPADKDLDEAVTLVPHDAAWPSAFAAERARIAGATGMEPEHIGSTAIPNLPAKPVIDMMAGVEALTRVRGDISRLEILGYENLGEAGVPGRIYLRLRGERDFNLHIVERGGAHWTNNLALRELLRHDPAARERYAAGKQAALASAGNRLLAYSAAKRAILDELLEQARNH
jgi:GrpB-like predicted nucleotidyltransferase (UPF0157 family)